MKRVPETNNMLILMIFVCLCAALPNISFAYNRVNIGAERIIDGYVQSRPALQKRAQELEYNQMIAYIQMFRNGQWDDMFKSVLKYNELGQAIEQLSQPTANEEMGDTTKYTYIYDDQGRMKEFINQSLSGDEWIDANKGSITYDENGNITEQFTLSWVDGAWKNASRTINTFDRDGNMTEELAQNWVSSAWENFVQAINTFDEQGNVIERIQGVTRNGEMIISKSIYTYNSQGLKSEEFQQAYLEEEDEFANSYKMTYSYNDQDSLTEELSYSWRDSEWSISFKVSNTYDEQGRITERLTQNLIYDEWVGFIRSLYSYDYVPVAVEQDDDTLEQILLSANYPNPFNLSTTISFSLPRAGHAELVIFNVTGQKVRNLLSEDVTDGLHSIVWDGCDDSGNAVTTGVYFSRLRTPDSTVSGRMLLVK